MVSNVILLYALIGVKLAQLSSERLHPATYGNRWRDPQSNLGWILYCISAFSPRKTIPRKVMVWSRSAQKCSLCVRATRE